MAPANRVDLLVKAPQTVPSGPVSIRIQQVMGRSSAPRIPDPSITRELLTVEVSGQPVTRGGQPADMPFLDRMPDPPEFLKPITDEEFKRHGSIRRTLEFNSGTPQTGSRQHTINGLQFHESNADIDRKSGGWGRG